MKYNILMIAKRQTKLKHLVIAYTVQTIFDSGECMILVGVAGVHRFCFVVCSWVQMYLKGLEFTWAQGIRKSKYWDLCIGWYPAERLRPLRLLAELWLYWFIFPVWWKQRFSSTVSALLPISLHVWTYEYCYEGRRGRPAHECSPPHLCVLKTRLIYDWGPNRKIFIH